MESYNDYLQHWGILGMKWGQRNGPPYPLSSKQMNKEERKKAKQFTKDLNDANERLRTRMVTMTKMDQEIQKNSSMIVDYPKKDRTKYALTTTQEEAAYQQAVKAVEEGRKEVLDLLKKIDASSMDVVAKYVQIGSDGSILKKDIDSDHIRELINDGKVLDPYTVINFFGTTYMLTNGDYKVKPKN